MFEQSFADIFTNYRELIGDIGFDVFQKTVVPMAQRILRGDAKLCKECLNAHIDDASLLPPEKIVTYWDGVDNLSFEYHLSRESDHTLSSQDDWMFHIRLREHFESRYSDSRLSPKYVSETPDLHDENYRICFVKSSLEKAADFLAGHCTLDVSLFGGGLRQGFHPRFSLDYCLGASRADFLDAGSGGLHPIYTPVSRSPDHGPGDINVCVTYRPIEVEVVKIPIVALLPADVSRLRLEGEQIFLRGKCDNPDIETAKDAGTEYSVYMQERAVLEYALRVFFCSQNKE